MVSVIFSLILRMISSSLSYWSAINFFRASLSFFSTYFTSFLSIIDYTELSSPSSDEWPSSPYPFWESSASSSNNYFIFLFAFYSRFFLLRLLFPSALAGFSLDFLCFFYFSSPPDCSFFAFFFWLLLVLPDFIVYLDIYC